MTKDALDSDFRLSSRAGGVSQSAGHCSNECGHACDNMVSTSHGRSKSQEVRHAGVTVSPSTSRVTSVGRNSDASPPNHVNSGASPPNHVNGDALPPNHVLHAAGSQACKVGFTTLQSKSAPSQMTRHDSPPHGVPASCVSSPLVEVRASEPSASQPCHQAGSASHSSHDSAPRLWPRDHAYSEAQRLRDWQHGSRYSGASSAEEPSRLVGPDLQQAVPVAGSGMIKSDGCNGRVAYVDGAAIGSREGSLGRLLRAGDVSDGGKRRLLRAGDVKDGGKRHHDAGMRAGHAVCKV